MLQQTGDIMWQKQSKAEDMESPKKVVVPPNHAKLDRFSLEIGDLGIPHFNPDFARIPLRLLTGTRNHHLHSPSQGRVIGLTDACSHGIGGVTTFRYCSFLGILDQAAGHGFLAAGCPLQCQGHREFDALRLHIFCKDSPLADSMQNSGAFPTGTGFPNSAISK